MARIRTAAACVFATAVVLTVSAPAAWARVATKSNSSASAPEIEVVNLVGRPDGTTPTVKLVERVAASGKKPKKLVVADFADPSDFVKVPKATPLELVPSDDTEGSLFVDPLKKGDRLTIVVYGTQNSGDTGMQQLTIVNKGKRAKAGDVVEWPDVEAGSATAMIFTGPLLGVLPEDTASTGYYFVTPGAGCLQSVDESSQDLGFGGNIPEFFVLDPGATDVAGTADGCDGAPVIGPETVNASAGDHVGVITYGTGPGDVHLLVLPFDIT